jgi:PHO85 cyclin-1
MSDAQSMQIFLQSPVTQDMIHHLVSVTLQILPCDNSKTVTEVIPSPPNSPSSSPIVKTKPLPSLMTFITKLVRYTNVYTGTLMSTIIYMNRLRSKLPKDARGLPCTRHRIFLACLIIASKNLNDSSPKNKHWAKYTDGLFRKEDVNLMERQLLMLLDWDVQIDNAELVHAWKRFLDPIKSDLKKNSRIRNNLSKGMLVGSTQTIVVPKETLVSPVTSDSESDIDASASTSSLSLHSRNTSVSSSIYSANSLHSRASSVSSLESQSQSNSSVHNVSKLLPVSYNNNNNNNNNSNTQLKKALNSLNANTPISNYLKSVAMKEEQELNDLIREYCGY